MASTRKSPSLSRLLKAGTFPAIRESERAQADRELESLQHEMLRIQQGIWHSKRRAILVFEGFDASGKGGAIRRLTEPLDPRGVRVYPIGAPTADEQGQHYLHRFWEKLPSAGMIAIFDRSWYGRVLVERVEGLAPEKRWKDAYSEILEFERLLARDGVDVIKIFLAITADEQLRRFEARLNDPYKQWKLTREDIRNRSHWDDYVKAVDEMFRKTSPRDLPWHLVPANHKPFARREVLRIVTRHLQGHGKWMEERARRQNAKSLREALKELTN